MEIGDKTMYKIVSTEEENIRFIFADDRSLRAERQRAFKIGPNFNSPELINTTL